MVGLIKCVINENHLIVHMAIPVQCIKVISSAFNASSSVSDVEIECKTLTCTSPYN